MAQTETESKGTLEQIRENKARASAVAKGEELPAGAAPIEAGGEEPAPELHNEIESGVAEQPKTPPGEEAAPPPKKMIRIGDQEFENQDDAFRYAERLEYEKQSNESYSRGVQEALNQINPPAPPPEDNFEERFFSNPKQVIQEAEERATQRAMDIINKEKARESTWKKFGDLYPDLADSRREVERILNENWETLGKVTDEAKGMSLLATKVRSYFDEIVERRKPRTELPASRKQAVSTGSGSSPSVTPGKSEARPLTMVEQMRSMKR